ncbi:MAG: hypothetical protein K6C96_09170 [Butyrivibrio sp.]|nr:hypothetical protein [Butyrivibrio sp.]
MEALFSLLFYVAVIAAVIYKVKKKGGITGAGTRPGTPQIPGMSKEPSSMPHEHRRAGNYDTFSGKKTHNRASGSMSHKHETKKYTSQADASKLPPGYILLNGEPVRVADLEGK